MVSHGSECLLLSIAINFMLFISVVVLGIIQFSKPQQSYSHRHNVSLNDIDTPSLCFPCKEASSVRNVNWYFLDKMRSICCVRHKESHQHLLKMMLLAERHKNNSGEKPYVAHFYLNNSALEHSVIRWTTNLNGTLAFVANGFQPSKTGHIRIPESGQYYIYCLLSFNVESNTNDTYITHYLYKERDILKTDHQRTELLASQSLTISSHVNFQNSFLSTTQSLEKGDSVFISVSEVSAIYRSNQFSYFGMFRL
ncbi:hypothetical protein CHS0354_000085 [Potamilus streckersoni]|uniref:THD domain-containing protein n=1 Tax=Potamilus streckersoni TaxID=2493646 RepID=A0AAE0WE67_9BIVA|nr:hypothetical protein CHS0354_000085 [Potamilus streckersoni]